MEEGSPECSNGDLVANYESRQLVGGSFTTKPDANTEKKEKMHEQDGNERLRDFRHKLDSLLCVDPT